MSEPPNAFHLLWSEKQVRRIASHGLAGAIAGAVGATILVATDKPLRDLMGHTQGGWLAFWLLVASFVITFTSIACGHAIITIGQDEDD